MKKIIIALLLLCLTFPIYSQSRKELKYQIYKLEKQVLENETLKVENQRLTTENEKLKAENKRLDSEVSWYKPANAKSSTQPETEYPSGEKPNIIAKGQCKAITAAGSQCKRNASEGSDYCWQHKGKQTEQKDEIYDSGTTKVNKSSGTTTGSGRTIQTGSRGGQYYINKNGNKTYIKRK